jgi:hypothetical protein
MKKPARLRLVGLVTRNGLLYIIDYQIFVNLSVFCRSDLHIHYWIGFVNQDFKIKFVQNTNMGAQSLDKDFLQYWMRLSVVEKQSLFQVAKHYVELKDDTAPISVEQYNTEIDEAMKRMDAGEFYTHDQVKEMSKGWLNGK